VLNLLGDNKPILDKLLNTPYFPLYNKDLPIILFWTPKSGCTTLNKWFFFQIGLLGKINQKSAQLVHGYRVNEYRKEPYYTQELKTNLLKGTKDTFKLVRNPYRRAVSSYLDTISFQWLISKFNSDVDKGLSFKQYLLYLKNLGDSINRMDRHLAPQYIEGEERFIKNYIKLENFNNHIQEIENKYGLLTAPLSQISRSSHHFSGKMVKKGNFAEEVLNVKKCADGFPTYKSFYNKQTKELVREVFSKDFSVYGFEEDSLII
jgi:hypothetical protein